MPEHPWTLKSRLGDVVLVPPAPEHDISIATVRSLPETRRFLRFLPPSMTVEQATARRLALKDDPRSLVFIVESLLEGTPKFAGIASVSMIDPWNNSCELGIIISPEFYGKGLVTSIFYTLISFVFDERKFHKITFETGTDNTSMRYWLENIGGATLEANRKECWKDGDGYSDACGYAILSHQWEGGIKAALEKRLDERAKKE